ncbi:MAG: amidohydrolase family protein [Pseudomonadota bacterium]
MIREDWLNQHDEPIVDPELPICDPHHHLWDHELSRYLLDELLADAHSGHRVVSTVFVECASMYRATGPESLRSVGEVEFVNGIAAMAASGNYGDVAVAAGIVSFADLTLGAALGPVLDAHAAASPRFRGVRHAAGWDASPEVRNSHTNPPQSLFLDASFQAGVRMLGARGLTFDAWLYHSQLPELTVLARTCPDTQIVLDHFGGPLGIGPYAGRQLEIFERWRQDLVELASCPNVVAKLGGLVMPINGFGLHKAPRPPSSDQLVELTAPYYRYAIEIFGSERCMFESNFPVDKQSVSYRVLWNSFKKLVADASASERRALFHDTAVRTYRLETARP